ncbi:MAG: hypothetical protein J3K34DRAFT_54286 [Monoraphidium minutum]|nr:MAG: hypothetical protein J3K34DRAFT_54286 [Monoraphidium minutum]
MARVNMAARALAVLLLAAFACEAVTAVSAGELHRLTSSGTDRVDPNLRPTLASLVWAFRAGDMSREWQHNTCTTCWSGCAGACCLSPPPEVMTRHICHHPPASSERPTAAPSPTQAAPSTRSSSSAVASSPSTAGPASCAATTAPSRWSATAGSRWPGPTTAGTTSAPLSPATSPCSPATRARAAASPPPRASWATR